MWSAFAFGTMALVAGSIGTGLAHDVLAQKYKRPADVVATRSATKGLSGYVFFAQCSFSILMLSSQHNCVAYAF